MMEELIQRLYMLIKGTVMAIFTVGVAQKLGIYLINTLGACLTAVAAAACVYFAQMYLQKKWPSKFKKNE